MAVLKCKMCGGNLSLNEGSSLAQCEYCGSIQTVPNADNEKKLTLFSRANRLRFNCEFDKAAGVYEAIVAEFPQEAEAYWGLVLCKYGIEYVDDPATGKKIPTCHRASFNTILEDSDYEQTLENSDSTARKIYRDEAKQIEELRKNLLEVTSKADAYDIFICYKETGENGERTLDSVLAQDIYNALIDKGYRVFFSRISLEDKLGQEYEPYIFAALNSAKVMLAVGTDYEHYNAVWVRNEWSRYLKLMREDHAKHLIPCYKGLDAYDMPKEFAKLQAQDLGKIGAIQDLLRGIEKLFMPTTQTPITNRENNCAELLAMGNEALQSGDWRLASNHFDLALTLDPRNADAYVGKLMVQCKRKKRDALAKSRKLIHKSIFYKQAIEFAGDRIKEELEGYRKANISRWWRRIFAAIGAAAIATACIFVALEIAYRKTIDAVYSGTISGQQAYDFFSKIEWCKKPSSYALHLIEKSTRQGTCPETIIVPDNVTSIGYGEFMGCTNVKSITLSDSITNIDNMAFNGTSLETINIPDSVETIGGGAFSDCKKLTCITLPNGITNITPNLFRHCTSLESIEIPDSVTEIKSSAFLGCVNLTKVIIPDSVVTIEQQAFSDCDALTTVVIPDSVTTIGDLAFAKCQLLESVTIPDSVTSLGFSAFGSCPSLRTVYFQSEAQKLKFQEYFPGCQLIVQQK